MWEAAWEDGLALAVKETGLDFNVFPSEMPWSEEEILMKDWYPEPAVH